MAAAIAKARASLPDFWRKFAHHSANEDRFINATVGNTPENVTYVKFGQRIEFEQDQISDWMYYRDGKIVGNFTMRPLLARMPSAEAAHYRAMLAEP